MTRRFLSVLFLAVVAAVPAPADNHNAYPLPEERGSAGILSALQKLPVYAHVLYVIAHPDDESPGTLVWLSRRKHVRTALYSLTRGEGGQNILGSEKYEAMGLLRTGELLEACRFYGAEPYFSTAFEFGFSKSAEETLAKWGKERTLEELVRFIRIWQPAVIISQFAGTAADGHGHHQAAGILTREAFRAAGNPARFPEQSTQGLLPWQAKALFQRSREGSLTVPVGAYDPVLGRSYTEIGMEGYSKHRSQGNGARFVLPGLANDYYELADSTLPESTGQSSLLDPIDTSLVSILDLAGKEAGATLTLKPLLQATGESARKAVRLFEPAHPERAAPAVAEGLETLHRALAALPASALTPAARQSVRRALEEKVRDFEHALDATLGIYLSGLAEEPTAVAGETIALEGRLVNRGPETVELERLTVRAPEMWEVRERPGARAGTAVRAGEGTTLAWNVSIPGTVVVTEPSWYRVRPDDTHYAIRPGQASFIPFEEPLMSLEAVYSFRDVKVTSATPVQAMTNDPIRGVDFVDFQIVPSVSVSVSPSPVIVPITVEPQTRKIMVTVRADRKEAVSGKVRLKLPPGWSSLPAEADFLISRKGEEAYVPVTVHVPAQARSSQVAVEASVDLDSKTYGRGYQKISYPENWTRHLYTPARVEFRIFDYRVRSGLRVGYVPGAGDDVPVALEQLGASVQVLSGADLSSGGLSAFSAIVTGIRAYNVNQALRANNGRLLEYVRNGGTLIVQYCRPEGAQPFAYSPFPFVISSADRITVEESPVTLLAPGHPILTSPNRITSSDFDGWIQERGLYFAREWDARYTPLLSGADPGETQLRGGMLVAKYGKGCYIYTAYAWFRQLPAGVPGAYRILANMLSLRRQP